MRAASLTQFVPFVLTLSLTLAVQAQAADKIIIDGSTGVAPLVAALAKAYQAQSAATTIDIGKGLGTKERIQALSDGKIDIAMASPGINIATFNGKE